MSMDAIGPGKTALVTGGADGIGLAAACRFAAAGMNVVIADVQEPRFAEAEAALREAGAPEVMMARVDVADRSAIVALGEAVTERFGGIDVLMCNAGIQGGSDIFDTKGTWDRVMAVNLGGIVTACQVLVPGMIARGAPGLVINTGSKQGITTPPGDPAYNLAKAGVKVFTEALQHHLRGLEVPVSAHLLVPGFVWTGLTRGDRTEKPAGAWTPEQTAGFMMESLARGDFYILCPDNEVTRAMDEKRMAWAMGDLIENRPPLSRWHKDWAGPFAAFFKGD
jgi:NAD(P)-dependent dehydrogenase (short-subunit alcohol dehydrogenase family)